jgi:Flp pilus assembly protein TadD
VGTWAVIAAVATVAGGCGKGTSGGRRASEGPAKPAAADLGPDPAAARRKHAEALVLIRRGTPAAAEPLLRESLAADMAFGPAHNSLGSVYLRQSKLYEAAWEFQYAAKLMPDAPEPRNNLGLTFEQVGKLDDAVGWFQRAVALRPDDPVLLGNLARARVRRGDRGEDVRALLADLIAKDLRPEWVSWAREQLTVGPNRPATGPARGAGT